MNESRGGVDLADIMISLYCTKIKTKEVVPKSSFPLSGYCKSKCMAFVPLTCGPDECTKTTTTVFA